MFYFNFIIDGKTCIWRDGCTEGRGAKENYLSTKTKFQYQKNVSAKFIKNVFKKTQTPTKAMARKMKKKHFHITHRPLVISTKTKNNKY